MKKIYYVDISNVKLSEINLSLISNERLTKSDLINDELRKIQSLTGYLLLRYVFKLKNININEYEFSYENNKPYIKGLNYHFNITHSKNIVAITISDSPVGLDCECIDLDRKLNAINYLFTLSELQEYNKLDEINKKHYFYKKWVEKEAYFKMIGKGLTKDFNKICDLGYDIYHITCKNNLSYYLCSTNQESSLMEVNFNIINL